MSLLFDAIQWYLVASGVAGALVLIGGWLWQRGQRPTHPHAVYGPFRPNLRKIL